MIEEKVILVDINDNPIGLINKLEAHEKAVLHRAFSVFILKLMFPMLENQILKNKKSNFENPIFGKIQN